MDPISTALFFIEHYAVLLLFLSASFVAGGYVLGKLLPGESDGRVFLYTSTGLAMLCVFLFYVALAGLLSKAFVSVSLVLATAYCLYSLYKKHPAGFYLRIDGRLSRARLVAYIAITLLVLPLLVPPLYPPQNIWSDELTYHLPYARFYVKHGGLAVNPFLRFPLFSHNYELLYSLSLLFYDDILAHLFHAAAAILTALGVYHIGKQTHSRTAGFVAAAFFLSCRQVTNSMQTSDVDLGLTLFVFLAFFGIVRWTLSKNDRWLYLAGFAAGIAMGTKYTAIMYFLMFLLWVFLERRDTAAVLKFLVPALVFGLPWYVRNAVISGDPFSPFGGRYFGYWIWNKWDLFGLNKDLTLHGTPRTVLSFIKLPVNLYRHPELFPGGWTESGPFALGMFAAIPGFLMLPWLPPLYRKVSAFIAANILFWFFTTQIPRYLLPILPMAALFSGVVVTLVFEKVVAKPVRSLVAGAKSSGSISSMAGWVPVVFLSILPVFTFDYGVAKNMHADPLPVTKEMRERYLSAKFPEYSVVLMANKTKMPIYQLCLPNSFYFADVPISGDCFGPARYCSIEPCLSKPEKLRKALFSMDRRLLLVNKKGYIKFNYDSSFEPYFYILVDTPDVALYMLR